MRQILIMDDDENSRFGITLLLENLGFAVIAVENGEKAIEVCKKALEASRPIDIAVLDLVVVGGMGGEETVKRLRELDPNIKVLVSSGYYSNPILAQPKEYGFAGALKKPFSIEELVQAIDGLL